MLVRKGLCCEAHGVFHGCGHEVFVVFCPQLDLENDGRSLESYDTGTAQAVNTLSFNLVRELRKYDARGNIIFSPLSISAAFALAYYGADGPTRNQIEWVFGFQVGQYSHKSGPGYKNILLGFDSLNRIVKQYYHGEKSLISCM